MNTGAKLLLGGFATGGLVYLLFIRSDDYMVIQFVKNQTWAAAAQYDHLTKSAAMKKCSELAFNNGIEKAGIVYGPAGAHGIRTPVSACHFGTNGQPTQGSGTVDDLVAAGVPLPTF